MSGIFAPEMLINIVGSSDERSQGKARIESKLRIVNPNRMPPLLLNADTYKLEQIPSLHTDVSV